MKVFALSPPRALAIAACALAAISLPLAGPDDADKTDFIRFVEGEKGEGKLETAIVTYSDRGGVEVDLIGAVHVADSGYYKKLEARCKRYDTLLYEMIKDHDAVPGPTPRGADNLLTMFQRGMKDALGLEFQLDGIDYSKPNFVHADLDPRTFFRLQKEKGESILGLLWKATLKSFERAEKEGSKNQPGALELMAAFLSSDSQSSLKLLLARQLEDMELILAGFEEGTEGGSVIVVERNKVVIEALRSALAKGNKKVGILYGAGHMPDLEKRLTGDLRLKLTRTEWITAWDIQKKGAAAKKAEADDPKTGAGKDAAPEGEVRGKSGRGTRRDRAGPPPADEEDSRKE